MGSIGPNGVGRSATIRILLGARPSGPWQGPSLGPSDAGRAGPGQVGGRIRIRRYAALRDEDTRLAHAFHPVDLPLLGPGVCRNSAEAIRFEIGTEDQRALARPAREDALAVSPPFSRVFVAKSRRRRQSKARARRAPEAYLTVRRGARPRLIRREERAATRPARETRRGTPHWRMDPAL